jgi:hypothetical protein
MSAITQGLKKKQPKASAGPSEAEYRAWRAAIATLDRVAGNLEQQWGVDRLQTLVPADLAARFAAAQEQLDVAIAGGDVQVAAQKAAALGRGWRALDTAAREAGHTPNDVGTVWCYDLDGTSYVVCLRTVDCSTAAARYPDHTAVSLEELLRILRSSEAGRWVSAIKQTFPGAALTQFGLKRFKVSDFSDDIPF